MDDLEDLDAEIAALSRDGHGAPRIAAELGLSRHVIEKTLRRLGLRAPSGRPLEAGARRSVTRSVKLTEEEAAEVDAAAGGSFTAWARAVLLRAARERD